jgi:serine protease Do
MKHQSKKLFGGLSVLILISMGYEVAVHEVHQHENPTAQTLHFIDSAYGQNLERGFADLVKKVIPGVVNISTYARPRQQQYGYGSDAQSELFRRFFEEFFGGRVPPPGGRMGPGDDQPRVAPKSKSVPVALGTGFIIDAAEGLILTNNHVVQGAEEVKIQFREEESDLVSAEIIGRDPELDVALLKVKAKAKLIAIPMGDSDAMC